MMIEERNLAHKMVKDEQDNEKKNVAKTKFQAELKSAHYGTKPGHFETSIIHFSMSEGVSKVSERVSERANE